MARRTKIELDVTDAELDALWSAFVRGVDELQYEGDDWRADGNGAAYAAKSAATERVRAKFVAAVGSETIDRVVRDRR